MTKRRSAKRKRAVGMILAAVLVLLLLVLGYWIIFHPAGNEQENGVSGETGVSEENGGGITQEKDSEDFEDALAALQEPADPLEASELSGGFLILVNKSHPVENGKPDDLVYAPYFADRSGADNRYIREEACDAYGKLVEAAKEAGYDIRLTSAFRTYEKQEFYYNNYVQTKGQEWADKYSAKPGTSEHQTGLAIDVSAPSVGWELTDAFGDTEEGKWLAAHCGEFGFVIRYPSDKEDITGYAYEPWHIRYVGRDAAGVIHEEGLCLEEYLAKYGE